MSDDRSAETALKPPAFRRGVAAAMDGQPITACPYKDHRTARGGVTWSRFYRKAWHEGWLSVASSDV